MRRTKPLLSVSRDGQPADKLIVPLRLLPASRAKILLIPSFTRPGRSRATTRVHTLEGMVGRVGIEPTTKRLRVSCSTS